MFLKLFVKNCPKTINTFRFFHQSFPVLASNIDFSKISSTSSVIEPQQDALLLQNIKTASDTLELFDMIKGKQSEMTHTTIMKTLKSLFMLEKSGSASMQSIKILDHPEFDQLCKNLYTKLRRLEINDIIESLKVLTYLGVPSNSKLISALLNLVRHNINEITLGHIIFLDFLLKKMQKTPLVEALTMALPMLLQIQLNSKLDHENVQQLCELLCFISRTKVSEQCKLNVISALTLHGNEISSDIAKSIIWSLCDMQLTNRNHEKLLENCINCLVTNFNDLPFEDYDTTISKMIEKFLNTNNSSFYSELFLTTTINRIIEKDVGFLKGIFMLKKINKIKFVSLQLLEYLTVKVLENPLHIIEATPTVLSAFVTGFSHINYKPNNWQQIIDNLLKNKFLFCDHDSFPWFRFVLELLSLDCYCQSLIEKLFNDEFLSKYFKNRGHNRLDYLQLLQMHQILMILHPNENLLNSIEIKKHINYAMEINTFKFNPLIKRALEICYGDDEYVLTGLHTKYGHFIDHVILFDNEKKEPIKWTTLFDNRSDILYFEDVNQSEEYQAIAILTLPRAHFCLNVPRIKGIFAMGIRALEITGCSVVYFNADAWLEFPDHEKIPYLDREIRFKL